MIEIDVVRETIIEFCHTFVAEPYLCYTEHGQHALFYTMLYNALPDEQRYATLHGKRMCVIQKEYPTAGKLGKPRRQHWDIALIQTPPASETSIPQAYDYLRLAAVVEFGLNVATEHLVDDIERLVHPEANVAQGFVVHLYRISTPGAPFSKRDWSPNSAQILTPGQVAQLTVGLPVEVFYGMHDGTGRHRQGVRLIKDGEVCLLT